jgi:hypothetical protein
VRANHPRHQELAAEGDDLFAFDRLDLRCALSNDPALNAKVASAHIRRIEAHKGR